MKYVSVTSPESGMSAPIFKYFDDYLISLGEPVTSQAWNIKNVIKHLKHMLRSQPEKKELYIDSGGFQIIVGYVSLNRIKEYIDTYHHALELCRDEIKQIFTLDIFNEKFFSLDKAGNRYCSENALYDYNKLSILESIKLITEYPEIANKQLFVLQTSNKNTFDTWKKLFVDLEVYKYFKRWSIGGLVGLKKDTNAKFSHAVPATLWLLTYQKKYNFPIDQVHWLGQSSRLSFLSMALFERLYNINMTSDSSQLVRFADIKQKFPLICKHNNEFVLIESESDVLNIMLKDNTVIHETLHYDKEGVDKHINSIDYYNTYGRFHNTDFIEIQSQNVYYEIEFGNYIADRIIEIGLDNITEEQHLKDLHPIMARGRTAHELMNNINYFKKFKTIIENADTDSADKIVDEVVMDYHERKTEKLKKIKN